MSIAFFNRNPIFHKHTIFSSKNGIKVVCNNGEDAIFNYNSPSNKVSAQYFPYCICLLSLFYSTFLLYSIPFNHRKEKQIQKNRPCPRKTRKMLTRRLLASQGIRSIVQSCKFLELRSKGTRLDYANVCEWKIMSGRVLIWIDVSLTHLRAMNCKEINTDVLAANGFLFREEVLTLHPSSMISFYYIWH